MSKSLTRVRLAISLALAFAMSVPLVASAENGTLGFGGELGNNKLARLATFDSSTGEISFALSLTPQLESKSNHSADVAIYVDTSASQTGPFRKDSLNTVRALLQNLDSKDRVALYAVDLDPELMSKGFIAPDSQEMEEALNRLADRTPLGSTDMAGFLTQAADVFDQDSKNPRNVIYVGDGVSRASIIGTERFATLVKSLVEKRISISSFAIGPERDIELLAALANHTGGNTFVDTDNTSSTDDGAAGLSITVRGTVVWPESVSLPAEFSEVLPATIPPLRTDRDTVIIGSLEKRNAFKVSLDGIANNEKVSMTWNIEPEASNGEFSFLPKLVQETRGSGGVALPTVGSAGLREVARIMLASSRQLTQLGAQVLATGNADAAEAIVETALEADPSNEFAGTLKEAIEQEEGVVPQDEEAPQDNGGTTEELTAPAETQDPVEGDSGFDLDMRQPQDSNQEGRLLDLAGDDEFIDGVAGQRNARNQQLEAKVNNELRIGRELLSSAPQQAIDRLKAMLETVNRIPDLTPDFRSRLEGRLTSALRSFAVQKESFDSEQVLINRTRAIAEENNRLVQEVVRRENELKELFDRFDSLMDEEQYFPAEEVIETAYATAPNLPETNAGEEFAPIRRHWERVWELRNRRAEGLLLTLIEVEDSAIPFSGEPPILYDDPEVWAEKVERRRKWKNVRLSGNQAEEDILAAMERKTNFDFQDTLFSEVVAQLQEDFDIPIVVDTSAEDAGLTEDETINLQLPNISLRAGLKILLDEYDCAYIVDDEVLKIVSQEVAEENQIINIYNVADLIAPRQNFGGGFGGGGGGFGGGQGGFGRGGGGGGFGRGGGGFGGGGGGGFFCVQDSLDLPTQKTSIKTDVKKPQVLSVEDVTGETSNQKWDRYFADNFANPADIRFTVRQLMKDQNVDETLNVISGAMRNGQTQPWMYEAIILAMRIKGSDTKEMERAVMSAVDMSDDIDELMVAAMFMSKNGMESRSLQVLREVSQAYPARVSPYALGLKTAQRINDLEGIQWACVGILSQEWPVHKDNVTRAKTAASAALIELERQGRLKERDAFNAKIAKAFNRDCLINVSWTGEADLDIYVEEPGGNVCSHLNQRTPGGGIMMGDRSSTKNQKGITTESYILPKGFTGEYRLMIRRVWGQVTSGKATVEIIRNYGTDKQTSQKQQVQLSEEGAIVLFKLDIGRRNEMLAENDLQSTSVDLRMNQKVLAQTLNGFGQSPSAADYITSRGGEGVYNGQLDPDFWRRRGNVGFQPVVEVLPAGTFMSAFAATADRLYVITAPNPNFTAITDVTTFNFVDGTTGDNGGGAPGGPGGPG